MASRRPLVQTDDDYPSLLWITVPPVVLLGFYFVRKWWLARRLRVHGIGKGAPGFQTGIRKVRITPEIRARLDRGENVSAEEIAAASAKADQESSPLASRAPVREFVEVNESRGTSGYGSLKRESSAKGSVDQDWLPDSVSQPKKRGKGKKK